MPNPKVFIAIFSMVLAVALANYLVMFPINDWLTWGAWSYPFTFLISEISNRFWGPKQARQIVYIGFIAGVAISFMLATPRIALASGFAFLAAQLLDIWVFDRLRQKTWWYAPFFASTLATLLDSIIFWTLGFYGEPIPVLTLAVGDFLIKLGVDVFMLLPFRIAVNSFFPCNKTSIQDRV